MMIKNPLADPGLSVYFLLSLFHFIFFGIVLLLPQECARNFVWKHDSSQLILSSRGALERMYIQSGE